MIGFMRKLVCNRVCSCQKRQSSGFDRYGRDKNVVANTKANFKPKALPLNPPESTRPISNIKAKPIKDS
jgi:hypothetical protein